MPPGELKHEKMFNELEAASAGEGTAVPGSKEIANDFAIDITHIEKMVQDTDSIILDRKPLEGVQSCLKSLREQMTDLQNQVYEQAKASSTWKYKLGFTCEKCEMKWEIEHQVKDSTSNESGNTDDFLDSPITQQLPKCNCPRVVDQETS